MMPNYRNNTMPYNTYRHNQMPMAMTKRDACKDMPMAMTKNDACKDMTLAMAYVPWQTWRDLYEPEKGFHCGTIFQELNLPFLGKGGVKR